MILIKTFQLIQGEKLHVLSGIGVSKKLYQQNQETYAFCATLKYFVN